MYQDLLIVEKGRVFVDVANYGCGSGCKYCYVSSSSEEQVLSSYDELRQVVEYLNGYGENENCIVSFCPNTEPFKSKDSIDRVLFVLRGLQKGRFTVQISTKEYISDALLQELDILAQESTIFINISMPFLKSQEIEPGAANIGQRVSNIKEIQRYSHLKSGLYIKPCTQSAVANVEKYIAIINEAEPDYVCIGVAFEKQMGIPCATLHRENEAEKVISAQKNLFAGFAEKIRSSVKCSVVYSSICAIFQAGCCTCTLYCGIMMKISAIPVMNFTGLISGEYERAERKCVRTRMPV